MDKDQILSFPLIVFLNAPKQSYVASRNVCHDIDLQGQSKVAEATEYYHTI